MDRSWKGTGNSGWNMIWITGVSFRNTAI